MCFFFFNDTATTEIYTLSLHDALPIFGVDAGELLFADREGDDRDVGRLDALVSELLVERHVGVAVDGRDHRRLLAGRAELLDVGDDRLPVGIDRKSVV